MLGKRIMTEDSGATTYDFICTANCKNACAHTGYVQCKCSNKSARIKSQSFNTKYKADMSRNFDSSMSD